MENTNTQSPEKKERKERTVSTSFIEKIAERENLTTPQLLEAVLEMSKQDPSKGFKQILTAYADTKRKRGTNGSGKQNDPNRDYITLMFEKGLTPMLDGELVRIQNSRKHKDNDNMYSVALSHAGGDKTTFYVDMSNINAVSIYAGAVAIGSPINLSPYIQNNESSEGQNSASTSNVDQNSTFDNVQGNTSGLV